MRTLFLEGKTHNPKKEFLFFYGFLLSIQIVVGILAYGEFDLFNPLKLATLFSGTCLIFISMRPRSKEAFTISFLFYFLISILIGLLSSLGCIEESRLVTTGEGILIFFFFHFFPILGVILFLKKDFNQLTLLIPFFFSLIFYILPLFTELAWLTKWIKGMDLLLTMLGFYLFVENRFLYKNTPAPKARAKQALAVGCLLGPISSIICPFRIFMFSKVE